MELEKQVSNKDLSIQLRDLGVPQNSHFDWVIHSAIRKEDEGVYLWEHETYNADGRKWYSAFTVAELGLLLGKAHILDFMKAYLEVMDLYLQQIDPSEMSHNLMTQPDIAAKMLVYLLKNKLITL